MNGCHTEKEHLFSFSADRKAQRSFKVIVIVADCYWGEMSLHQLITLMPLQIATGNVRGPFP